MRVLTRSRERHGQQTCTLLTRPSEHEQRIDVQELERKDKISHPTPQGKLAIQPPQKRSRKQIGREAKQRSKTRDDGDRLLRFVTSPAWFLWFPDSSKRHIKKVSISGGPSCGNSLHQHSEACGDTVSPAQAKPQRTHSAHLEQSLRG